MDSSIAIPDTFLTADDGNKQLNQSLTWHQDNSDDIVDAPTLTAGGSVKVIILGLLAVTSLVGNTATLINIIRSKKVQKTRSSLYTLLVQLAAADLLVSLWCLLGEAIWTFTVEWKAGQVLCKTFKFSQVFSLYLSTSTMVLIGFDRLFAIRRPIHHRSCMGPIGAAWLVSALLASPQLAIFRVVQGPFRQPFQQCVTYGFYTEEWQEQLYSIFSLLTMFIIPLTALIGCYACIFCTIAREKERMYLTYRKPGCWKQPPSFLDSVGNEDHAADGLNEHQRRLREELYRRSSSCHQCAMDRRRDIFQKAKTKSLRISIIIVSAFIVCWAPYYFMMITFIFLKPDDKLGEDLQSAIFFFGMSNSLINPLIYGAFHLYRHPRGKPVRRNRARPLMAIGTFSAASQMNCLRHKGLSLGSAAVFRMRRRRRCRRRKTPAFIVDLHLPPPPPIEFCSYSHSSGSDRSSPRCPFQYERRLPFTATTRL